MKAALSLVMVTFAFLNMAMAWAADVGSKQIPPISPYRSFDEAIHEIEQATGLKVSCPEDAAKVTRAVWLKDRIFSASLGAEIFTTKITVHKLLDTVCSDLGLSWKSGPEDGVVSVDFPWRVLDPRSPADLLRVIWKPTYKGDFSKDGEWRKAFDALLCSSANLEKAAVVRQSDVLAQIFRLPDSLLAYFGRSLSEAPMIAVSGEKYLCVFSALPMQISPGSGCLSYYWFREDGTLVGAGILNIGHRCHWVGCAVNIAEGDAARQPSELQVKLKFNGSGLMIASFVLGDDGLKLTKLADGRGHPVDNFYDIGVSLLPATR